MPSLLVLMFGLELVVHLVNTIGAATINNLLWTVFLYLPSETSKGFVEYRKQQVEFHKVRKDLNATSSQDEFARWAKLRRQHDKLVEQLEKKKSSIDATKTSFERYVSAARWLGTRGMQFFLPMWFSKEPMFWLPYGWFPYYAEWLLSFPKAPMGSVSIASWQVACSSMILLVSDTVVGMLSLVNAAKQKQKQKQKVPMKTAGSQEKQNGPEQEAESKKEL